MAIRKPKWIAGSPNARGSYWVVWQTSDGERTVMPIDISPALIHMGDPSARLQMKTLGGMAYAYEPNRIRITHYMPIVHPEAP